MLSNNKQNSRVSTSDREMSRETEREREREKRKMKNQKNISQDVNKGTEKKTLALKVKRERRGGRERRKKDRGRELK